MTDNNSKTKNNFMKAKTKQTNIERTINPGTYAPFLLLQTFMNEPNRLWTIEELLKDVEMYGYVHNSRTLISALSYLLENDHVWFIDNSNYLTANPINRAEFYTD